MVKSSRVRWTMKKTKKTIAEQPYRRVTSTHAWATGHRRRSARRCPSKGCPTWPWPGARMRQGGRAGIRILPTRSIAYPEVVHLARNETLGLPEKTGEDRSAAPLLVVVPPNDLLSRNPSRSLRPKRRPARHNRANTGNRSAAPLLVVVSPNDSSSRNPSRSFRKKRRPARREALYD